MSLFDAAAEEARAASAPLAARLRPHRLDDMVGQEHLLGPSAPLRAMIESDSIGSLILWGPPGSGKTTIARIVADTTERRFIPLSAVTAGVRDVREAAAAAHRSLGEDGRRTLLFVDEVHRFNRAQQDTLLPFVEEGMLSFIGATTENPFFEINGPLLSRSLLLRTDPLAVEDLERLLRRSLERLAAESPPPPTVADTVIVELARMAGGDARRALLGLETLLALARARRGSSGGNPECIDSEDLAASGLARSFPYTRDAHYDMASALIKSLRGSDPDAGLYWLARILASGGDPRFIARRLVILASEDVGEADPASLPIAVAAASAVEMVGMPEAALNLAQAVVHLAAAPKSNRCAQGLWKVQECIARWPGEQPAVPLHLCDSHFTGAPDLGYGSGYRYPHDDPRGWVEQDYLPGELGREARGPFYQPSAHGEEPALAERLGRAGSGR